MSVEKIESMEWHRTEEQPGDGLIRIELRDLFEPYLLGTSYCDTVAIWWDSHAGNYDESVKVYAVENKHMAKVESWYDCDITEALKWVQENLT